MLTSKPKQTAQLTCQLKLILDFSALISQENFNNLLTCKHCKIVATALKSNPFNNEILILIQCWNCPIV